MQERNYAREQVRRISRNTILTMLILGGIVTALLVTKAANPFNLFWRNAAVNDLADLQGSYEHNLFWVEADVQYMDLRYTVSEDTRVVSRYYFWYADDGGYVCVHSNARTMTQNEYNNVTLTGWLSKPNDDDAEAIRRFTKEVMSSYNVTEEEAAAWISPYVIHASTSRSFSQALTIAGYLFVLFVLWRILRGISHLSDYRRSKHYKRLGDSDDERESINSQVSADLDTGMLILDKGQTTITNHWVLQGSRTAFVVRRLNDLVWVYGNVTQHRTNGIPTGKTYALVLAFADGKILNMPTKNESEMKTLSARLQSLQGNRVFGFDADLKRMYDRDRPAFLQLARQMGENQRCDNAEESSDQADKVPQ